MVPTFAADPRVRLVAGADPRPEARTRLAHDFGARVYETAEALCEDSDVDLVYVAAPHQHHAPAALAAIAAGKHVLVEKPMALALDDAARMVEAAEQAGVVLVVGHSHGFDRPIAHARALIAGGTVGAVRMITALNFTDFLYRPRRPEELVTERGGGALFNQASHQVDIVRVLGGGRVASVRAHAGRWDASRPTEGAYAASFTFAEGAFATLTYSGYAHFDSDELCGNIGEMGEPRDPARYGAARRLLAATPPSDEVALKNARNYGGERYAEPKGGERWYQHFGFVLACCDRADLRPLPHGVMVYGDAQPQLEELPRPTVPRQEVIDEVYGAIVEGRPARHDGRWGLATLEACHAMLASARSGRDVELHLQCAYRDA